jgi:cytochrome c oxidase subunit 3
MSTTATTDVKTKGSVGAGGGGPFDPGDPKDWPPGYSRDDAMEPAKYRIGTWVGLASVAMLFMALTSAYIFRASSGDDWVPLHLPPVLWVSTVIILASSATFEAARRALRRHDFLSFSRWITSTTALGIVFLIGQLIAWRSLRAQGLYINSNPHGSFFYLLTSLHAIHLAAGLIALVGLTVAALRLRISAHKRNITEAVAIYWHFMDALWLYLFLLLFFL